MIVNKTNHNLHQMWRNCHIVEESFPPYSFFRKLIHKNSYPASTEQPERYLIPSLDMIIIILQCDWCSHFFNIKTRSDYVNLINTQCIKHVHVTILWFWWGIFWLFVHQSWHLIFIHCGMHHAVCSSVIWINSLAFTFMSPQLALIWWQLWFAVYLWMNMW